MLSVYCKVWIWIPNNLHCLSCKSINFVLLVKPTLISLFCIQSDIFHQSFSLRVNKFIIQYFGSLLCFSGPLSESEFLIVLSFNFPVIYLQIYCSIQTFNLVSYSLTSHFRGPGSHLKILGSRVPFKRSRVPGPTWPSWGPESYLRGTESHLGVPGLGYHFSGMPLFSSIFCLNICTLNWI